MITKSHYFGAKSYPVSHGENTEKLLHAVNALLHDAVNAGVYDYWIAPDTQTQISGERGGSGDGGYRLPESKTGPKGSAHRVGRAIDVYDPERKLAAWCIKNKAALAKHGLYIEDPRWTPGWVHVQDISPESGKRVYIPATTPPTATALPGQSPIPVRIK